MPLGEIAIIGIMVAVTIVGVVLALYITRHLDL